MSVNSRLMQMESTARSMQRTLQDHHEVLDGFHKERRSMMASSMQREIPGWSSHTESNTKYASVLAFRRESLENTVSNFKASQSMALPSWSKSSSPTADGASLPPIVSSASAPNLGQRQKPKHLGDRMDLLRAEAERNAAQLASGRKMLCEIRGVKPPEYEPQRSSALFPPLGVTARSTMRGTMRGMMRGTMRGTMRSSGFVPWEDKANNERMKMTTTMAESRISLR
eukprot:TRINITY_DN42716_c0_g1_i1.p1 TRINITY_DN42716_c0_g1~~TRINITY_DN42716_c0_g1_i1.p1  ORF type:complete len:240 (+),score=36.04 TRINITY_DN42716_c0_g1_i1:41-721(+)